MCQAKAPRGSRALDTFESTGCAVRFTASGSLIR
jgi:hypothetical protein